MSKLVKGIYVLSGSGGQRRFIKDGAVYIEGDIIRDVGKYKELSRKYCPEFELGSRNHLVMPGLVDAHHHGEGWSVQLGVMDSPLETWLKSLRVYRKESEIDSYNGALFACIKRIESGVTCILDHHYGPDPVDFKEYKDDLEDSIRAYADSGIRVALAPAIMNQNDWVYLDEEKFISKLPKVIREALEPYHLDPKHDSTRRKIYFKTLSNLFEKYNGLDERIKFLLGPSGVQWCSDDLLEEVKREAHRVGTGIHIHLLETKYQMKYGIRKFGKTLVQHLIDLGFLGPEVSCAHCVWLTKDDIDLFAKAKATAVHNPTSNLRVFSGISPILFMKEKGINVGLGMDDFLGLSNDDDMFQEMRLCSALHRVPGIDSSGLSSNQIIDMATIEGAKVAGFENEIGALQTGLKADMILVNLKRAFSPFISSTVPITDVIIHRLKGIDVDTVIVGGEIIMKNKRLTRVNKREVFKEVKRKVKEVDKETRKKLGKFNKYITNFYTKWDEDAIGYTYNAYDANLCPRTH